MMKPRTYIMRPEDIAAVASRYEYPKLVTPNKCERGRVFYDQDAHNLHGLLERKERVD